MTKLIMPILEEAEGLGASRGSVVSASVAGGALIAGLLLESAKHAR